MRRDSHGAGAEQDGPGGSVRDRSVSVEPSTGPLLVWRAQFRVISSTVLFQGRGREARPRARLQASEDVRERGRRRRERLPAPGVAMSPRDATLRRRLSGRPQIILRRAQISISNK